MEKILQEAKAKVNKMEEELVIAQLEKQKFLELEKELELTKTELNKSNSISQSSAQDSKTEISSQVGTHVYMLYSFIYLFFTA